LSNVLIDLIQVWSLLTIYLDIDEVLVHELGNFLIFKALMSHDVTPMTGGVPYTQKNGLIFISSFLKRFFSPGVPIHRMMLVLKEIGTGFMGKAISHRGARL
jgi:hypothetical protein